MKALLDENLPQKLKFDFPENFEVCTVHDMGWKAKTNGELLQLIQTNGFDALVTSDVKLLFLRPPITGIPLFYHLLN